MAKQNFTIRQGDLLPEIAAQLLDATGAAVALTGATVRFHMKAKGQTAKVAAAAVITAAATGHVKYVWAGSDTSAVGTYLAEWQVTFADLRTETFPNVCDDLTVTVTAQLA